MVKTFGLIFLLNFAVSAAAVSPLFERGYTVLPQPQVVQLRAGDIRFGPDWRLELGPGVQRSNVAVESLTEDLQSRFGVQLAGGRNVNKLLRLAITPSSVSIGSAIDRDQKALAEQAYKMELSQDRISITANAPTGLFYGVQTLVQMMQRRAGALWLPEGQIVDWPDLELRAIYWDDAHHLDRLPELKRAIREAAFFKVNGFALKLEGHFQYKSAPALVEPDALSPAQLQELTDYGLRYYVELIPYLDGPAHIAFILKHPEYAPLRSFPDSNYEICATNPDSYKLINGMFQDLIDATKGAKYIHLSTDEAYYIGLADNPQCNEAARARELGSVGKLLAEFVTKVAGSIHDRGRTVFFWGEYPMKPDDIPAVPNYMINGETYGPQFDPIFKAHGIRSTHYVSVEGEEKMFPDYYVLPASERLHPDSSGSPRVETNFDVISFSPARKQADLMGMFVAGWADMGLHPETFWLGYLTTAAYAWHPGNPEPQEAISTFFPIFYGPSATNMGRIYQLMSYQAQYWADSWDTTTSTARRPIFGNSDHIYKNRRPVRDQTLPLPPVPAAEYLTFNSNWSSENARRLEAASKALRENDELLQLLYTNLGRVEFNRYNLEVLISIAQLCRQNLDMLQNLARINSSLETAHQEAIRQDPEKAIASLDETLDIAEAIRQSRNRVLQDASTTWYKSWHPRVAEGNGRRFLHELDDVKDHLPDRTVDMSYLVYRELLLPFGEWVKQVQAVRNKFAETHHLPARSGEFDWKNYGSLDR